MAEECTKEKLQFFSREHFTYINTIFGDQTVRQIIKETMSPENSLEFDHYPITNGAFAGGIHHVLRTKTGEMICSVDNRYQNPNVNENDTLCQSYSLLTFFGVPLDNKDHKQRQMDMIQMYRTILANENFRKTFLTEVVHEGNKRYWKDELKSLGNRIVYIKMDKDLIKKINVCLNHWEQYGYMWFTKKGECIHPNAKTRKRRSRRHDRSRSNHTILSQPRIRTLKRLSDFEY
jgi:hypothetical protein